MTGFDKSSIPSTEMALKGRSKAMPVADQHFVNGQALQRPFPGEIEVIYLGMGCFWGAERLFWQHQGVWTTAVGYAGGATPNPSYDEVCSGGTGHAEVVLVAYDPAKTSLENILKLFWESHDPTQGMRQGNDIGTQYRSVIYTTTEDQLNAAKEFRKQYQEALQGEHYGEITTEIQPAPEFYYAEDYHQQYLAKNPGGYCGIGGTGICLPASLSTHEAAN